MTREALLLKAREWLRQQPGCAGYPSCEGDLRGEEHEESCPMFGKREPDTTEVLADFCLSELAAKDEEISRIEQLLRREWWLHHGCPFGVYGDDGEMQCAMCGRDFKRMPLDQLELHTQLHRMGRALQREGPEKQNG